jgi:hypothetical protein
MKTIAPQQANMAFRLHTPTPAQNKPTAMDA